MEKKFTFNNVSEERGAKSITTPLAQHFKLSKEQES